MVTFAPVGLPVCEPGLPPDKLDDQLHDGIAAWIDSDAMSALLAEFGQGPLPAASLGERLTALESISARCWDYRKGLERHQALGEKFTAGRELRIRAAAAALGLAGRQTPAYESYDHVLVLGGG